MWPIVTDIARSVVCVSVYVCELGIRVSYAKISQLIKMLFGGLICLGSRNRILDGVKIT